MTIDTINASLFLQRRDPSFEISAHTYDLLHCSALSLGSNSRFDMSAIFTANYFFSES
jgi:hypothetical protein